MYEECDIFGSQIALKRAKENVEKYFAVVGVVELMNESLAVLENYVPFFFDGAKENYKKMKEINKNKQKPKIPREIKQSLISNFTTEIEFYEYCKQRLFKQHLVIK